MRDLAETYEWVYQVEELDNWTVAVTDGLAPTEVLEVYGGSEATRIVDLSFRGARDVVREALDTPNESRLAQIRVARSRVVVIEPGWAGSSHKVAREASRNGAFFSVYWSSTASRIVQAERGQLVAFFDPMHIGSPNYPEEIVPGWVGEGEFELPGLGAKMMAAMERQTGLAFDRAWLDEPTPTYRVAEPRNADLTLPFRSATQDESQAEASRITRGPVGLPRWRGLSAQTAEAQQPQRRRFRWWSISACSAWTSG